MRYNIFNKAHLPLKTALITSCLSINKIINDSTISAIATLREVEEVLNIFTEQVAYESSHILPFVFDYEPSVWNNYVNEHNKAANEVIKLRLLIQSYSKQKKADDKINFLSLISESYNDFMLSNFNHMHDEEAVLNEILWRYYPDNVLKQIEEKMEIIPHLVKQTEHRAGFQMANAA